MKLLLIGASSIFVFLLLASTGCRTCSITPPPTSTSADRTNAVEISSQLSKIVNAANITASFDSSVQNNFDKLSDSNAALLLFLNAIDCYLSHGKIGQDVANQMAQVVKQRWGAANGLAGGMPTLSPIEKHIIAESPDSEAITARLNEFGIQ